MAEIKKKKVSELPEATDTTGFWIFGSKTVGNVVTSCRFAFDKITSLFGVSQDKGQSITLAPSQKLFTDEIAQLERDKQNKLVAGANITIDPDTNVISSSGGTDFLNVDILYRDVDTAWTNGYINDVGNVAQAGTGNWQYTIIPVIPGEAITVWRDESTLWRTDYNIYYKIYLYATNEINSANYKGKVSVPYLTVPNGVNYIVLTAAAAVDKVSQVRLSQGLNAPFDNVFRQLKDDLLPDDLLREGEVYTRAEVNAQFLSKTDGISQDKLDNKLGQQGVLSSVYPFLKLLTHSIANPLLITPNRYINSNTGVVVGGGDAWKLYAWFPAEELTDYTVWQAVDVPFVDSTYHYIGCFFAMEESAWIGIATNKGNGTHTTLSGTKYIALSIQGSTWGTETIRVIKGKDMPYNAPARWALNPSPDNGIGVNADSMIGQLNPDQIGRLNSVNINNSDKVLFIGNSYTAGGWQLKNKHYSNNLSMLLDMPTLTNGIGASTLLGLYNNVYTNRAALSKKGIKYAVIALQQNNSVTGEVYYSQLVNFCALLKSMKMIPVLSTEHYSDTHNKYQKALQQFAEDNGVMFMNWGNMAEGTKVLGFAPFFYTPAGHVGTRGYWTWVNGMYPCLNTLRVDKSMKLFRKRPTADFSTLPTYRNNFERGVFFQEIGNGVPGYKADFEKYVDRAQNAGSANSEASDNGYNELLNGNTITFSGYLLIEYSYNATNVSVLKMLSSISGVTGAKLRIQDGTWKDITYSSELNLLPEINNLFENKVSILLQGSSMIYTSAELQYVGDTLTLPIPQQPIRALGESLVEPLMTSTKWTAGLPEYVPVVNPDNTAQSEPLPSGITKVIELNSSSLELKQTFNTTVSTAFHAQKYQVRVLCRFFPKFVDTDEKWATSEITADTFDMARMSVTLNDTKGSLTKDVYVGLWWNEVVFEQLLSGANTGCTITIQSPDSKNIQIAKVELIPAS